MWLYIQYGFKFFAQSYLPISIFNKVSANLISMQQVAMTSVDHFGEKIIIIIGENLKSGGGGNI